MSVNHRRIDKFVESLRTAQMPAETSEGRGMVNIYDDMHDPGGWRRERLRRFMTIPREGHPLVLFVGISPGEKGAAVSGVGFSSKKTFSETPDPRLIPVGDGTEWISMYGDDVAPTEATATIFWDVVGPAFSKHPLQVTWNAVPFWTYIAENGVLKNRSHLLACEVELGRQLLTDILGLFEFDTVVAVGAEPASLLRNMELDATEVCHPSYGRKREFRAGIEELLDELKS